MAAMAHTPIHPATSMGAVALVVTDLARSLDYYERRIGLAVHRREDGYAALGTGGPDLLVLYELPGARPVQRQHTGLYHFAILTPFRRELARTLQHLADTRTRIDGMSDHAVSEAIYLTDPDGHGIEIYRDRPRNEWQFPNGALKMTVDPLDLDGVLAELDGTEPAWTGLHPATTIGHVHLQVNDVAAAEQFYVGTLGMDLMARYGSAASFVAAGGYHHHLGLNTWHSLGAPPPPDDAARLLWYEIILPDKDALDQTLAQLEAAGSPAHEDSDGHLVRDPAGNTLRLRQT